MLAKDATKVGLAALNWTLFGEIGKTIEDCHTARPAEPNPTPSRAHSAPAGVHS